MVYHTDKSGLVYVIQISCSLVVDKLQRQLRLGSNENISERCLEEIGLALHGDRAALSALRDLVQPMRKVLSDVARDIDLLVAFLTEWFTLPDPEPVGCA